MRNSWPAQEEKCEANKKKASAVKPVILKLASLARLERATHCLEGSCSILLSYRDIISLPDSLDSSTTPATLASQTFTRTSTGSL